MNQYVIKHKKRGVYLTRSSSPRVQWDGRGGPRYTEDINLARLFLGIKPAARHALSYSKEVSRQLVVQPVKVLVVETEV